MTALLITRKSGIQPAREAVIDPASPFARDFLVGYLPTIGNRFFGAAAGSPRLAGVPRYVYDRRFGTGIRRADAFGTGINKSRLTRRVDPAGDLTMLAISRPSPNITTSSYLVTMAQGSNAVSFSARSSNGTTRAYCGTLYVGGATRTFGGSFAIGDDLPIAVVVSRQINGVEQALFVNGVKDPVVSNVSGSTITLSFFGNYSAAAETETYLTLAWTRALSDAEIKSISADPYQMFLDRPIVYWPTSADLPVLQQAGIGLVGGKYVQLTANSGQRPLVWHNGRIQQRVGTEGTPLVLIDGVFHCVAADTPLIY